MLRRYLLGRLSSDDRIAFEQWMDEDPEAETRVDFAESGLIEEFVAKKLSAEDEHDFQRVFLNSEDRRNRLAMARGIAAISNQARNRKLMGLGAAVAVVVIAAGLWPGGRSGDVSSPVVVLKPNSQRNSEAVPVILLRNAKETVELELLCQGAPPVVGLALTLIGEANARLAVRNLSSGSGVVRVPIAKSVLAVGDYSVVVDAGETYRADFVLQVAP